METLAMNRSRTSVETILQYTYGIVPIVAGLDKFFHLLTDWEKYLSSVALSVIPFSGHTFMILVGIIEIVAGILVFVKPKIGAYVVMFWLIGIAINLVFARYYDIAVRDLVMAIGAFTLAKLADHK